MLFWSGVSGEALEALWGGLGPSSRRPGGAKLATPPPHPTPPPGAIFWRCFFAALAPQPCCMRRAALFRGRQPSRAHRRPMFPPRFTRTCIFPTGCGHRCGRARARTRATAPSPEPVLRWAPMASAAPRPGVSPPRACGCGNGLGGFLCWPGRTSCAELSSCCVPRPPVFCRCRGRRPSGRTEAVASPEDCWKTREVKGPHWSLGPQTVEESQAWCWLPGHLGSQPIPWLRVCAPGRLSDDQGLWSTVANLGKENGGGLRGWRP